MKLDSDALPRARLSLGKVLLRILMSVLVLVVLILSLAFGAMWVLINGPSPAARDLFVTTCMETSFAKLFPPLFLSNVEIEKIQAANAVHETDEITDTDIEFIETAGKEKQPDIEVVDVVGETFKGKMMIVKDPSRLRVVSPDVFGAEASGEKLDEMLKKVNAVAGINGGGFADENGVGSGGQPIGVVVRNGEFLCGNGGGATSIVGFDENNVLQVGTMTSAQIIERKIRDAVSFGPALIVNGKSAKISGNSGGLNPRTAIGQREDGSVLLLVIDGRQPHSLGATFKDLIDVFTQFGAVNAGNLDGGSSSMLYHNGELISTCASVYGPRKIATGFAVL